MYGGFRPLISAGAYGQIAVVHEQVNKVGQVVFAVSQYYVDSINTEEMTDKMLKTIVGRLDPHSSYIPAEEVQAMNEPWKATLKEWALNLPYFDSLVVVTPVAEVLQTWWVSGR